MEATTADTLSTRPKCGSCDIIPPLESQSTRKGEPGKEYRLRNSILDVRDRMQGEGILRSSGTENRTPTTANFRTHVVSSPVSACDRDDLDHSESSVFRSCHARANPNMQEVYFE